MTVVLVVDVVVVVVSGAVPEQAHRTNNESKRFIDSPQV
jgi:hypothetical protein